MVIGKTQFIKQVNECLKSAELPTIIEICNKYFSDIMVVEPAIEVNCVKIIKLGGYNVKPR